MRILFVSPFLPYPPVAGGHRQIWSWLTRLSKHHELAFVGFYEREAEEVNVAEVARHCAVTRVRLRQPTPHAYYSFAQVPRFVSEWYSAELAQDVQEVARDFQPEVVQFLHTNMGQYTKYVPGVPSVVTALDLAWVAHRRRIASLRGIERWSARWEWLRMLRYETALFARARHVITMSEHDAALVRAVARHDHVSAIPPGVDSPLFAPRERHPEPGRVLYLGHMEHFPNLDGLVWLYQEMWPIIIAGFPAARLVVAGSGAREELRRYAPEMLAAMERDPTIELAGFVLDLAAEMDRCALLAAPLRLGAGVRNKIIEAMAAGLPLVTTTLGAEGLAAQSGRHLLISDTPQAFAQSVVRLLGDSALQQALSQAGKELTQRDHDNDNLTEKLELALLQAAGIRA
jgi:glycosyltransferase involved in cell wall biosynthesis